MVGGFYVAGLFGYAGNTATDCSNEGKITVNGSYDLYNSRYGHLDIAGCICRRANATYANVDNKGDIEVNVNYTSTANKHSGDPNHLLVGGVFAGFGGDDALTNCDNSGNITIGEGTIVEKADVFLCVGGVTATSAAGVNHTNCHNSGNITMNGTAKHGAIIGGLIARNVSAATYEKCSNSGNILITTGKEGTSYTKSAYAGGMSGSQSSNVCTCTGFTNSGSIIFRGKTTDTCRLGGIVGSQTQAATAWTGLVNTGDITLEGEYVDSKTFVGGIIGNSSKGISGSQTLCNITAIGASNVGMVLGVARSTSIIASGCKVGGTITTKMTTTEDSDGIEVSIPDTVALTENNFFEYIYSSIIDETAAAEDGCSYISEIAKGE
jgi:hypothetical protein